MTVRIVTEPLGGPELARLAQAGSAPADWYPPRPRGTAEWLRHADQVRASVPAGWLEALSPAFGDSSGGVPPRLARTAAGRGVIVTTGQQPGLFGGPVYTWSKALSALALADALEAATGVPVAPVFWAATDDSDFAEASSTMFARAGGADRVAIEPTAPDGTRMSDVPLPDMAALLERLAEACGSSADARPLAAARQAYGRGAGATVGSAYVELLRVLLEPLGVAVLDASHPAVGVAAHPLAIRALHERERVTRALAARGRDLVAAGHEPQVSEVRDMTLVFERKGPRRERITRARAAVAAAGAEPGSLSPNVLLRPVVERALLPSVAYVAGPGEMAYFAQVSAVAQALDLDTPLVVPRWSTTLVEPDVAAILERYGLAIADFAEPDAVETRLARDAWPSALAEALRTMRSDTARNLSRVRAALHELDGLVAEATVDGAGRGMEWRLGRLERRITAAVKRRESALMRDLGTVRGSLYPGGIRQERALNLIPLMARHGLGLLDAMRARAAVHARSLLESAEAAVAP